MSSVIRSLAQVHSRYLLSEDGPYIHTYADMQSAFASYNPVYASHNIILFANDDDLGHAIKALEIAAADINQYTDSHVSLLDLGRKLYLGVVGEDSTLFTYSLVRVTRGSFNDGGAYFVLTGAGPLSPETTTALDSYGEIYVTA